MADSTNSKETKDPTSQPPGPDNPTSQSDPSPPPPSSSLTPPATVTPDSIPNPNPNPNSTTPPLTLVSLPQPPPIQPYPPSQVATVPSLAQSFRPAGPSVPLPSAPQYVPLNFQNPGVQPPGVSTVMMPPAASGVGSVTASSVPIMMSYAPPGQLSMRPYAAMPNGYPTMAGPAPPGILRYPTLYASMIRPGFPQRPLGSIGFVPALSRPPLLGIRGPIIPPVVRPAVLPISTQTEKPQPTVYVGKISSTVENDFMLSLLQLCGPVKSWNRPQDPTNGALKGFGICEFDSAEGVLRALRLLSKLNVDGQELMLNVNQATREFLERYVGDKKKAHENKANEKEGTEKEEEKTILAAEKKDETEDSKEAEKNKEIKELGSFGLITDEEKEADRVASEKLKSMLEVRLKTKPLPPPPPPPLPQPAMDASGGHSNSEIPARSRDGLDSDVDVMRRDGTEDRNDDETTSEPDKVETATSPERSRRNDRKSRDRERDSKRDKERELERLERDREQERAKRERDREYKNREDERRFRARLKEWESRERERDHARKLEREREKEREQERKWEIIDQERESEDVYSSKKRKYKTSNSDDRKRRLREKEDDLADRLKEDQEIAEAKRRAEEEREIQQKQSENTFKILSANSTANGTDIRTELPYQTNVEMQDAEVDVHASDDDSGHGNHTGGDDIHQNGTGDESGTGTSDTRQQSSNAPTRKLGFGLVGSGKRTAVPSVFHEEEDEDAQKDKKMRPLVPIDYSTEELQAVSDSTGAAPSSNLAAAAEFAKRIASANNPKEDNRADAEKERSSRRTHERSSSHHHHHHHRDREEDKAKAQENKKLLDAKQLIDAIPKTKEDLFSYEINWVIYDKNDLHEKMRPWISKKITEFLGEEETTLVDYIVSSTREHVKAPDMLERLQAILDDEAEMFVLKMWRMLIFEIKRVETGLVSRSKA